MSRRAPARGAVASTRARTCSRVWHQRPRWHVEGRCSSKGGARREGQCVSMGSRGSEATGSETLAAVREILPALRARAGEAEAQRKVPAESIKELQQAGATRLLQPTRWGGL